MRAVPDGATLPERQGSMRRYFLAVLAYIVATFATQAISHFAVNVDHYAAVAHIRDEPILPLGLLSMLVQGAVLAFLYGRMVGSAGSLRRAVGFAWLAGAFLVSYIALGEAGKYTVPGIRSWIGVEVAAGFVQFTFYGILLGLVYRETELSRRM